MAKTRAPEESQRPSKPLIWLQGEVKTPPFSQQGRREAGMLLRLLHHVPYRSRCHCDRRRVRQENSQDRSRSDRSLPETSQAVRRSGEGEQEKELGGLRIISMTDQQRLSLLALALGMSLRTADVTQAIFTRRTRFNEA